MTTRAGGRSGRGGNTRAVAAVSDGAGGAAAALAGAAATLAGAALATGAPCAAGRLVAGAGGAAVVAQPVPTARSKISARQIEARGRMVLPQPTRNHTDQATISLVPTPLLGRQRGGAPARLNLRADRPRGRDDT